MWSCSGPAVFWVEKGWFSLVKVAASKRSWRPAHIHPWCKDTAGLLMCPYFSFAWPTPPVCGPAEWQWQHSLSSMSSSLILLRHPLPDCQSCSGFGTVCTSYGPLNEVYNGILFNCGIVTEIVIGNAKWNPPLLNFKRHSFSDVIVIEIWHEIISW